MTTIVTHFRHSLALRCAAILTAVACVLVFIPAVAQAASASGSDNPAASTRTDGITNVLGDYDYEIREATPRADGIHHVDTPAMIAALQAEHVNTYAYLVWHESTDWDDLVNEFLPAAEAAQINVWVYLVPPSECCSQPFGADYVEWASQIATLSLQYPNLKAWVMDDFRSNPTTFTPAYVQQMESTAKAINPDLDLFPIVYPGQYDPEFVTDYGPNIDGAIFPYVGGANKDLNDLGPLRDQLDAAVSAMQSLHEHLYLMPYVAKLSASPHPATAETISTMIDVGREYMQEGKLDGIMLYGAPLNPATIDCPPSFPGVLQLIAPWNTPTPGGDYVQASEQITVDPNASSYSISFYEQDTFQVLAVDEGYYMKELLVDGQVVWQTDVATDAANTWNQVTVDLSAALAGKSTATVTFRLDNPTGVHNFGLTYRLAQVTGTGITVPDGDFTDPTGWTFDSTNPAFTAGFDTYRCDPNLQYELFDAIQAGYGPSSLVYRSMAAVGVTDGQRHALVSLSENALRQHEHGREQSAIGMTRALSRLAGALGLPILSAQAASVASELS
jgi:hypothetical protein